jgi:hypothetical protein
MTGLALYDLPLVATHFSGVSEVPLSSLQIPHEGRHAEARLLLFYMHCPCLLVKCGGQFRDNIN